MGNTARVLIIADDGTGLDLTYAVYRMREEQLNVTIASPKKKRLNVVFHQQEEGWDTYIERPWYSVSSDASLDEIDPSKFDALLLPGGRAPEGLRNFEHCKRIVRHFVESNKPIAAICRGPLILVEAGVRGKRLTGLSLIRPRINLRGCTYVEARGEAVIDGNIITVTGRPYYHVWIREFLSMLKERGLYSLKKYKEKGAVNKARILTLIAEGSSSGHLDYSHSRMLEEGFDVTVAAPVKKPLRTVIHQGGGAGWDTHEEMLGLIVQPDASLDEVMPSAFAALVIPGARGPEQLRVDKRAVDIVRHFVESNKPIAAICHGPLLLAEALAAAGVKGRRLTSVEAVEADVLAAECTYIKTEGEAVVDGNIITARKTPEYHVWMRAFVALLKELGIKPS